MELLRDKFNIAVIIAVILIIIYYLYSHKSKISKYVKSKFSRKTSKKKPKNLEDGFDDTLTELQESLGAENDDLADQINSLIPQ